MISIERHPTLPQYDYVRIGYSCLPYNRHLEHVVTLRHAKMIVNSLLEGKSYALASPVYNLPKKDLAELHVHAEQILAA